MKILTASVLKKDLKNLLQYNTKLVAAATIRLYHLLTLQRGKLPVDDFKENDIRFVFSKNTVGKFLLIIIPSFTTVSISISVTDKRNVFIFNLTFPISVSK